MCSLPYVCLYVNVVRLCLLSYQEKNTPKVKLKNKYTFPQIQNLTAYQVAWNDDLI